MLTYSSSKKPIYIILLLFIFCSIGSFIYSLVTSTYNGDFLGVSVKISFLELFFNLTCNIIPYLLLWIIYKKSKNINEKRRAKIPLTFFGRFLIALIFWNILVTILFGVGVLAAPPYEAPSGIKVVIQVMNRFNYAYGVFIYLLICPKKDKLQIVLIILLLLLAYLRAGLGIFLYLAMIYLVKHYDFVKNMVKKRIVLLSVILISFPLLVNSLYALRAELRNQKVEEEVENPLSGVLMGRMSSFSDSAFILQNWNSFENKVVHMDNFYFQLQCLGGVVSMDFMPQIRPERLLFLYYYYDLEDNVAYMAGTNGNLYMSFMKSPLVFVMNLLNIILFIYLTFKCFRKIDFKYNNELAFILLIYVITSGVANEFAFLLFSIFVYYLLFKFINSFR